MYVLPPARWLRNRTRVVAVRAATREINSDVGRQDWSWLVALPRWRCQLLERSSNSYMLVLLSLLAALGTNTDAQSLRAGSNIRRGYVVGSPVEERRKSSLLKGAALPGSIATVASRTRPILLSFYAMRRWVRACAVLDYSLRAKHHRVCSVDVYDLLFYTLHHFVRAIVACPLSLCARHYCLRSSFCAGHVGTRGICAAARDAYPAF